MPIVKDEHRSQFVTINTRSMQDARLSWEARGVLAYLLSKPAEWIVRQSDLQAQGKCGKDRVQRIINELRDLGYVTHTRERDPRTGRLGGQTITVHETPVSMNHRTPGFPEYGEQGVLVKKEGLIKNERREHTTIHVRESPSSTSPSSVIKTMAIGSELAKAVVQEWQKDTDCPSLQAFVIATSEGLKYASDVLDAIDKSGLPNFDAERMTEADWRDKLLKVYRHRYGHEPKFRELESVTITFLLGTALAFWQEDQNGRHADVNTSSALSAAYSALAA